MSAIGPKQTWACALHMSALGGKADIARHLAFDPSGRPLFTLGYSCKPISALLHF